MHQRAVFITLLGLTLLAGVVSPSFSHFLRAEMASTNYRIDWDTISNGGLDTSSSASYQLRDTIGNPAVGNASSSSYNLAAGYRGGVEDQVLTFTLLPQAATTGQVATSLSLNTVTVVSTTDFSVDDYAAVVQDIGTSQIVGFGKITSKTSGTLTFDDLDDNGTAPTVDGSNDRVYLLEGTDVSFDALSASEVVAEIIGFEVTAASDNGYSIQIADDGNLRSGAVDIDDVSDGGVSVGSEEYGGRSSDTSLSGSTFDTADSALTTSFQPVVTEASTAFDDRNFLILKAAAGSGTGGGTYTQVLTVVATGNY